MKKFYFLIFVLLLTLPGFSIKIADLPEVLKPKFLEAAGDSIYIASPDTVYIYSGKTGVHLKTFLNRGQGPGEIQHIQKITIFNNSLQLEDWGKLLFFTLEGKFIKEERLGSKLSAIEPLEKGFLARKGFTDEKTRGYHFNFNLYNKKSEIVKTLLRNRILIAGGGNFTKQTIYPIDHLPVVKTGNKKIFIYDKKKGFHITIYNMKGEVIRTIEKDFVKVPVFKSFKERFIKEMEKDKNWQVLKDRFAVVFHDFFPAMETFWVENRNIYTLMYTQDEKIREIWKLNFKGKLLDKFKVPQGDLGFTLGAMNMTLQEETYFYLVENEETEMYELHAQKLGKDN